jgi:hypothetical protein
MFDIGRESQSSFNDCIFSAMSEAADRLIAYCREHRLWEMLPDRRQSGAAWEPAFPLILAAWYETSAMLKMVRLAEHIQWAEKDNALPEVAAFLRGLREDEWRHLGE